MKNLLIRLLFVTIGFVNLSNGQTITIGSQVWMTKNLDVSTFRNGDSIREAKTNEEWWSATLSKSPAWCYYNNDPKNGENYGKLYNWYAVNDPRGLAPQGWHIPSDSEWDTLFNFLGGKSDAGRKLKTTCGWEKYGIGTNESGFSALPGGCRSSQGNFYQKGFSGDWWSSKGETYEAFYFSIGYVNAPRQGKFNEGFGLSIRCISDLGRPNYAANPISAQELLLNQNSNPEKQSVVIGSQEWMIKNLDVSTFANGDPIMEVKTRKKWIKAEKKRKPAWCYYNYDPDNGEKYGKLYNWYAINDPRGLNPDGWHIPNDSEWDTLFNFLGGGDIAGKKMKSKYDWIDPTSCFNGTGTDSSGFNGLPSGGCDFSGSFHFIGEHGYWWSSTEYNEESVWVRRLNCFEELENRNY